MSAYLFSVIQGVVEGLTEFLPISSTGHMILVEKLLSDYGIVLSAEPEVAKTFEVFIQLGAILAVAVLYRAKIGKMLAALVGKSPVVGADTVSAGFGNSSVGNPSAGNAVAGNAVVGNASAGAEGGSPASDGSEPAIPGGGLTVWHILVAMIPAVVLGLLAHKTIKSVLFGPGPVLIGLVIGGIYLIVAERFQPQVTASDLDQVSFRQAAGIGLFQCLALWPGFSRAGATIAGGLLLGVNHRTAADFSFLLAIPMMCAASALDLAKSAKYLSWADAGPFAVGFLVSFVVAWLAVVGFLKFLERTRLTPFAVYRFVLAAVSGLYFYGR